MAHTATIFADWGVFFALEAPAETVKRLLAPGLDLEVTENGTALVTLNIVHFIQGGENVALPETYELDIGVRVPVDNTGYDGQPQAASAVHVLNITATSEGYLDVCRESGYQVHAAHTLSFDIADDGLSGSVSDADGVILSFRSDPGNLAFAAFSRIGQDVVHDHRGEYRLNYVFDGIGADVSATGSITLTAHDHPFFREIPVPGEAVTCVEQSMLQRGEKASLSFYGPELPDDAAAADPNTDTH